MKMAFDWNNITIKGKDILGLCFGIITAVLVASSINNKIGNIGDDVQDIRKTQLEFQKEYKSDKDVINHRLNNLETNDKLFDQKISTNFGK